MMRYKVVEWSMGGHACCFEATVVDTAKPMVIGGRAREDWFSAVCECSDSETARKIADALNEKEMARAERSGKDAGHVLKHTRAAVFEVLEAESRPGGMFQRGPAQ